MLTTIKNSKQRYKKVCFPFIISLLFIKSAFALSFYEGKEYICIDKPDYSAPNVLEFFSFYCQHCYLFDEVYKMNSRITKLLPNHIKVTKYHVNYLGPLSKQLTKAWAVAMILGIEDKISPLIFYAVQQTKSIHNQYDIRELFLKAGVSAQEYDSAWNSLAVKSLQKKQENTATNLKLVGVPSFFINGKYIIKNEGLDMTSTEVYITDLSNVIKFLINK